MASVENVRKYKKGPYSVFFKRFIDIVCSLIIILLFCWVYIIIAVLVKFKLGSPVLFKQDRPGKIDPKTGKETIFRLYKFRTMIDARDKKGKLFPDIDRLTKFGTWLRRTSLDEIPEMFNILKGDMSLVGPRPLLVKYLDRYTEEQHHRHAVRPGLTGYAQVHGRNNISWEDKFDMDVWYTKHVTFINDLKILLSTIKTVLKHEGINSETSATMEEFMGNEVECRKMNRLIIVGASGHGKVVADIAKKCGYKDIVFLDNDSSISSCVEYPVLGPDTMTAEIEGDVFIAVGDAGIRKRLMERDSNRHFPVLIHPDSVIAEDVEIGEGTVIMAGTVINPGVKICRGCIINTSSSIDHDCVIDDYCHVSVGAHLSGTVVVGCETWIGTGATVSNNVNICGGCMIGAGAVVIKDVDVPGTYVGVPAQMNAEKDMIRNIGGNI